MSINNVGSVVLTKLLRDNDLEAWAQLKKDYLHASLHTVYSVISKHCEKFHKLPTFEELDLEFREGGLRKSLEALKTVETDNIDIDVALSALVNEFTQNEILKLLGPFLDKLVLMDSEETKAALSDILLEVDEKTYSDNTIVIGSDYTIFESPEVTHSNRIAMGFSNKFDAEIGAYAEEMILIGGRRGSGKSLVCSNIQVAQYEQGNICPYFTIEMKASEIMQRNMAIMSGVPHKNIRHNTLSFEEDCKLAFVKSQMFINGLPFYEEFLVHKDRYKFETQLKNKGQRKENQLIVIDDRKLSLPGLDMYLSKLKAKYGDLLKVGIIDYMNQVTEHATVNNKTSKYEWVPQINVATGIKNLARKYGMCLISPFQIDATGEARFSKGILDPVDVAMTLSHEDDGIMFDITKLRGAKPIKFASSINWNEDSNLRIDPNELIIHHKEEGEDKKSKEETPPWNDSKSDLR